MPCRSPKRKSFWKQDQYGWMDWSSLFCSLGKLPCDKWREVHSPDDVPILTDDLDRELEDSCRKNGDPVQAGESFIIGYVHAYLLELYQDARLGLAKMKDGKANWKLGNHVVAALKAFHAFCETGRRSEIESPKALSAFIESLLGTFAEIRRRLKAFGIKANVLSSSFPDDFVNAIDEEVPPQVVSDTIPTPSEEGKLKQTAITAIKKLCGDGGDRRWEFLQFVPKFKARHVGKVTARQLLNYAECEYIIEDFRDWAEREQVKSMIKSLVRYNDKGCQYAFSLYAGAQRQVKNYREKKARHALGYVRPSPRSQGPMVTSRL